MNRSFWYHKQYSISWLKNTDWHKWYKKPTSSISTVSFLLLDFPFHFHVCWVCHEVSRLWRGLVSTGFTWRGPCLKLYTPSSKEKNTSHRRRNDLHMMFWCQFNISVWRQNKSVFFKMLSSKYFSSFDSGDKHFLQIWDQKLVENSLVV